MKIDFTLLYTYTGISCIQTFYNTRWYLKIAQGTIHFGQKF